MSKPRPPSCATCCNGCRRAFPSASGAGDACGFKCLCARPEPQCRAAVGPLLGGGVRWGTSPAFPAALRRSNLDPPPHPWPPPFGALLLELAPRAQSRRTSRRISAAKSCAPSSRGLPLSPRAADPDHHAHPGGSRRGSRRTGRTLEKVCDLRVAMLKALPHPHAPLRITSGGSARVARPDDHQ